MEQDVLQNDNGKNKVIIFLAIAIGVIVMIFMLQRFASISTKKKVPTDLPQPVASGHTTSETHEATADYIDLLNKTASDLNKTCPFMVDKETRLDNALAFSNNEFQYNYTLVNTRKEDIDLTSFESIMRPSILSVIKTNPDIKIFRDNATTLSYAYSDKNGEYLFKMTFTPEDYR